MTTPQQPQHIDAADLTANHIGETFEMTDYGHLEIRQIYHTGNGTWLSVTWPFPADGKHGPDGPPPRFLPSGASLTNIGWFFELEFAHGDVIALAGAA